MPFRGRVPSLVPGWWFGMSLLLASTLSLFPILPSRSCVVHLGLTRMIAETEAERDWVTDRVRDIDKELGRILSHLSSGISSSRPSGVEFRSQSAPQTIEWRVSNSRTDFFAIHQA